MTATDEFFLWFYDGLSGIGGWFIFLLIALAAVVWLIYDSSTRRIPATGWRLAVILLTAILLPAIVYRFSNPETRLSIENFREGIFYLGLLGGVVPPVLAVGYFVTFRGMVGCPNGHVYESVLGECPECARIAQQVPAGSQPIPRRPPVAPEPSRPAVAAPSKPKAQAWLAADQGRTYQLNLGDTTIGRSSENDIQLSGDSTVGRTHAKVVEQNNHFKIHDLASANGTRVNGRLVRQPILLEPDDQVQFGDNTTVRFVK